MVRNIETAQTYIFKFPSTYFPTKSLTYEIFEKKIFSQKTLCKGNSNDLLQNIWFLNDIFTHISLNCY